jgi:tripartite-type tricarboxylate transporter receptor subunit TctC
MHAPASTRRRSLVLGAGALAALPATAFAQASFPSKPLRIIVPFPAGGGADVGARNLAQHLSTSLGKPVVVENRAGGDGVIAALEAKKADPDGHSIYFATASSFSYVPATRRNPGYDPIADFIPLSHFVTFTFFLMVHESVPGKTLADVIAHVRANPGKLSYASANSTGILGMAQLAASAGLEMTHVPYKGEATVPVDMIPGRVQLFWATPAVTPQLMKDGKCRPVAVLLPNRSPAMPEVPTIAEAGQPLVDISPWGGMFAPAKTPKDICERLTRELRAAMGKPDLLETMNKFGLIMRSSSADELGQFTKAQLDAFAKAVRIAKIPIEG